MAGSRWSMASVMALSTLMAIAPATLASEPREFDVVVYGATPAGLVAAIAVRREGKSVVIIEPGQHIGGMVTGGLGATDHGNRSAIGGISREFFKRVRDHYVEAYGPDSPQVKDCSDGFKFEPHVATAVFRKMLDEAKVEVVFGSPIKEVIKDDVIVKYSSPNGDSGPFVQAGAHITSITTERGEIFVAAMYIDASYEGDLLAKAGVWSEVGREGSRDFHESLAGVQKRSPAHQWPVAVPAFGFDGQLLPFVQEHGRYQPVDYGDERVQAYNFRLCMTDRKDNQIPFPKPEEYDPDDYELLARYLARKPDLKVGQLMNPVRVPNGKTDTNNNGPFSTDHIGANWKYPRADAENRKKIRDDHVAYVEGFLYFLANDPRVPKSLHDEMNQWGLAKDEFVDTDHWPHQLYVREARRMKGAYFMTQADIMENRTKVDSVGLGSYNTDSHHVQRIAQADGSVLNEGDFQVAVKPYAIPYRSLIPKPEQCSNLLVPVCMSASHVAYGTIRMEPVYMILGQASGVAACQAIEEKVPVQAIVVEKLTAKLFAQGSILDPYKIPTPPNRFGLDPGKMEGIVVDDKEAEKAGKWTQSAAIGPYVGEGYLHHNCQDMTPAWIRFKPKLPKAGKYEVRLYSSPNPNRATNVIVSVLKKEEVVQSLQIDQRTPTKDGGPIKLGIFELEAGEVDSIFVSASQGDGHVIADAVQFIPVP